MIPDHIRQLASDLSALEKQRDKLAIQLSEMEADISAHQRIIARYSAQGVVTPESPTDAEKGKLTIPDCIVSVLTEENWEDGLSARDIADKIISMGMREKSDNFAISVSTACGRLEEKGKLKASTNEGRKLYSLAA